MMKNRHVVPNSHGGWSVRVSGATRASRVFYTQAEAMQYGRALAKKDGGVLYVHKHDGTVIGRESYGGDSSRPKG